jgi:hypothetical protein
VVAADRRPAAVAEGVELADVDRALAEVAALVQLVDHEPASGRLPFLRTVRPRLLVTIGPEDLLDLSTGPGAAEADFGRDPVRRPRSLCRRLRRHDHPLGPRP